MLIGLNENEGCTVVINHTDTAKTHSVVISNFGDGKLHIREFNPPASDNSDSEDPIPGIKDLPPDEGIKE